MPDRRRSPRPKSCHSAAPPPRSVCERSPVPHSARRSPGGSGREDRHVSGRHRRYVGSRSTPGLQPKPPAGSSASATRSAVALVWDHPEQQSAADPPIAAKAAVTPPLLRRRQTGTLGCRRRSAFWFGSADERAYPRSDERFNWSVSLPPPPPAAVEARAEQSHNQKRGTNPEEHSGVDDHAKCERDESRRPRHDQPREGAEIIVRVPHLTLV